MRGEGGVGEVVAITLLYFINKGIDYPIYDRFAHIGLIMIDEKSDFNRLVSDIELYKCFHSGCCDKRIVEDYNNYIGALTKHFGEGWKGSNRDIDRALWTYGHLFNDNKTNNKRIRLAINP